jgi:Pvc16 N-terminal domain
MDFTAIQSVTTAIKGRLNEALGEDPESDHVFVGPLHDDSAEDAYLVLFLYRVTPNADLRNTPHVVAGTNPGDASTTYDNGIPLDLYFIVTAGGRKDGGEIESLERIGRAIRALNDQPLFAGAPLANETVRVTLYPGTADELSRVWALFPDQNYRTSLLYLASPVWIDPASARVTAPPVVRTPYRVGPSATSGNA